MVARRSRGNGNINARFWFDHDPRRIEWAIRGLGEEARDMRPLFQRAWPIMRDSVRENLASQGATTSAGKWPPYSPTYEARKRRGTVRRGARSSQGRRLGLHLTGAMRAQVSGKGGLLSLRKRSVVFGTDKPYARAVQFGEGRRGQRWFVDWSPAAKARMQAEFRAYGEEIVARWVKKMEAARGSSFDGG